MMLLFVSTVLLLTFQENLLPSQQITGQDIDKILERADALLDEAKAAYEEARSKSSASAFVDAGFKLEEARIKYIVLQEIGSPEKQKIAADRLRAVNQLSKLIHDGKVAVSGKAADSPSPKPDAPVPPENAPAEKPPALKEKPPVDVSKRAAIPDATKQREAEKLVKELFKDQYAKKSPSDRQALGQALLRQADQSADDVASLWVLCREAQEVAIQACDTRTILLSIELVAHRFDVDALAMRANALQAAGKTAKNPAEFSALTKVVLVLIDDLIAADQYDAADKVATSALQSSRKANDAALLGRATTRGKEVAEAKGLYQSMKSVLETIAKTPDDPGANQEMGQFLCYVKGSWDLGIRFMVKGSDPALKALAEKEASNPADVADRVALADGWWDLAEKEKSPLRKGQLLAHAKSLYVDALADATGLLRAKIEKRVGEPWTAIFDKRSLDFMSPGCRPAWKVVDGALTKIADNTAQTREDFDDGEFRILFEESGMTRLKFCVHQGAQGEDAVLFEGAQLQALQGKTHEIVFQCRGKEVKAFLDGQPVQLTSRSAAQKGRVHIWGEGPTLRILSLEHRVLR
jgi:hypothetical protein